MRALRRLATPASVAVALGGCTFPLDEFQAPPARDDAALSTNGDAAYSSLDSSTSGDAAVPTDTLSTDAANEAATDAVVPTDASCVCVKQTGSKCKEWSPPGCKKSD